MSHEHRADEVTLCSLPITPCSRSALATSLSASISIRHYSMLSVLVTSWQETCALSPQVLASRGVRDSPVVCHSWAGSRPRASAVDVTAYTPTTWGIPAVSAGQRGGRSRFGNFPGTDSQLLRDRRARPPATWLATRAKTVPSPSGFVVTHIFQTPSGSPDGE